ncbi:hypothetical protein LCGC14_2746510 [marine sediment metagenome]|uniref:Uncharacterized protein n=1 Tax=marine sediment metagenome TaxID=412755 RepID=A0A0F8Z334_9ZZZZ
MLTDCMVNLAENIIQCPTCKKYFIRKSNRAIYCSRLCKDSVRDRPYQKQHGRVRTALANGTYKKPELCNKCNKKKRLCAHHPDYGDPLMIEWICYSCHGIIHTEEN